MVGLALPPRGDSLGERVGLRKRSRSGRGDGTDRPLWQRGRRCSCERGRGGSVVGGCVGAEVGERGRRCEVRTRRGIVRRGSVQDSRFGGRVGTRVGVDSRRREQQASNGPRLLRSTRPAGQPRRRSVGPSRAPSSVRRLSPPPPLKSSSSSSSRAMAADAMTHTPTGPPAAFDPTEHPHRRCRSTRAMTAARRRGLTLRFPWLTRQPAAQVFRPRLPSSVRPPGPSSSAARAAASLMPLRALPTAPPPRRLPSAPPPPPPSPPHSTKRPWLGQLDPPSVDRLPAHDPTCYLCPGVDRMGGATNPAYKDTYVRRSFTLASRASWQQSLTRTDEMLGAPALEDGRRDDSGASCAKRERMLTIPVLLSPVVTSRSSQMTSLPSSLPPLPLLLAPHPPRPPPPSSPPSPSPAGPKSSASRPDTI